MTGVKLRGVDGRLQVHAMVHVAKEYRQTPLILLVATRRAEGQPGLTVAADHRRCERCARPASRCQRGRQTLGEPEHLRPGW